MAGPRTAWEDSEATESKRVISRVGGGVGIDERSTHDEEPVEEGFEVVVLVNLRPEHFTQKRLEGVGNIPGATIHWEGGEIVAAPRNHFTDEISKEKVSGLLEVGGKVSALQHKVQAGFRAWHTLSTTKTEATSTMIQGVI